MKIAYGVDSKDGYYVRFTQGKEVQLFCERSDNLRELKVEVNPLPNTKEVNWYKVFHGEPFVVTYIGEGTNNRGAKDILFGGFGSRVDSAECALQRIEHIKETIKNSVTWADEFEYPRK